jgi:hypothetical protein
MKTPKKIILATRKWWRLHSEAFLSVLAHGMTVIVFTAMYLGLKKWLPPSTQISDLENSIQLLGQVLALVVGVLLLGTTVSLSSYDGADTLSSIHSEISTSTDPFFATFFEGGLRRHKLDIRQFHRRLLLRPKVEKLQFMQYGNNDTEEGWFIYRPHWDGVWYQVANSPFYHSNRTSHQLAQVQYLHEAVICANLVLKSIREFRASVSALLQTKNGTNGSKSFLKSFERYKTQTKLELPLELPLSDAMTAVMLALSSKHYMHEEFREHADNVDWEPFALSNFQLKYSDYMKSMIHLVTKLQILRLANLMQRFPIQSSQNSKRLWEFLWITKLGEIQTNLASLRGKIVTAHGVARYFHHIKVWSIPGIGVALFVLIGMLCGWPYLKWAADQPFRIQGFMILYSAAIASLVESSIFLARLLWKRRSSR